MSPSGPLARFLPPVPEGVAAAFLARYGGSPGADWVLDPFGGAPRLAVEVARLGVRLLVAISNPVTRFLLEMAAVPPSRSDLQAALADLAAARRGDERMESHLQELYLTECSRCRRSVPAEAFIWERGGEVPIRRVYSCPCGESGEFEVGAADEQRAGDVAAGVGLHRARALERVAAQGDPDREHVEEALRYYPPRAVYALLTVINKLDGLPLPAARRRCLQALVLTACDEANTLWPYPDERPRPKQLTVPPRYRENNVWLALERGVDLWAGEGQPVPFTIWPELPPEGGGICLFEGPLRDLAPCLKEISLQAVLTALPRPNQAFWTLSALWSGWLWGREAVTPFKMVLRRRRYDWAWHAEALQAALKNLAPNLPLAAPLFGIVAEPEPSYLTAAVLGAAAAGLDLTGVALRTPYDPVYLLWHRRAFAHKPAAGVRPDQTSEAREVDVAIEPDLTLPELARRAIHAYLSRRGEPATYLHIHAAALAALAEGGALAWRDEPLAGVQGPILAALGDSGFIHHGGTDNPETGLWGLPGLESEDPLPDQVEKIVVGFLNRNPGASLAEVEAALYTDLPGLLTPPLALTHAVLGSYAIASEGRYSLRPEDDSSTRRGDLEAAGEMLVQLGERLGFVPRWQEGGPRQLAWEEKGRLVYAFYLLASAAACRLVRANQHPPEACLLVLPGGRAGLLAYKLERDPVLKHIWESGWRLLKYRQLRRLAEIPGLDHRQFLVQLTADPLVQPEQMKMF
ncbi:MAG: hypothetical protein JXB85_15755 [Anaerolineales bacterium]|nr:hypothetical protein [Anaerolineales bacterium]